MIILNIFTPQQKNRNFFSDLTAISDEHFNSFKNDLTVAST